MKTIHYLLIGVEVLGESRVQFFESHEQAVAKFHQLTSLLLDLPGLMEGEDYEICGPFRIRFNASSHTELGDTLGNANHYFELKTLQVPLSSTHYFLTLRQEVDSSKVEFGSEQEVLSWYKTHKDTNLKDLHDNRRHIIKYDSLIEDEIDGDVLYREVFNQDKSVEVVFGHVEYYYGYRMGAIDKYERTVIDKLKEKISELDAMALECGKERDFYSARQYRAMIMGIEKAIKIINQQ